MVELLLEEERKQDESNTSEDFDVRRKIDIKRVFLSDLMLLLNHNHNNCRYGVFQKEESKFERSISLQN